MIRLQELGVSNVDLIKSTVRHPWVYPRISDDMSPPADKWEPVFNGVAAYMGAWDDDKFLGLWVIKRINGVTVEVHTCLLPEAAGPAGLAAAQELVTWIWGNTDFQRIETAVPQSNTLAVRFAVKAGLAQYGIRPKSFLKSGSLEDEILLGASKI